MTTTYRFAATGTLPPKKDGAASLWRKDPEVARVVRLRQAAAAAVGGRPSLARDVRLTLVVHVPPGLGRQAGDLDNYVTGVLDGLQAAAPGTPWREHPAWSEPGAAHVLPDRCVGLVDDAAVVEIVARKVEDAAEAWYDVTLEGTP